MLILDCWPDLIIYNCCCSIVSLILGSRDIACLDHAGPVIILLWGVASMHEIHCRLLKLSLKNACVYVYLPSISLQLENLQLWGYQTWLNNFTTQCIKVIRLAFANLEQFSAPVMGPYFHPFLFRVKISSWHAVYKACRYSSILGNYTLQVWYILDNKIKKVTGCPSLQNDKLSDPSGWWNHAC